MIQNTKPSYTHESITPASMSSEFQDFAYSVSHDLSAPVRAMVEFSKILESEHSAALNDEAQEYLRLIVASGKKLQAMMQGLLQYSRLNTMANAIVEVKLDDIITSLKTILSEELTQSRARLTYHNLPTIWADSDQLSQVFYILIHNAITYQPKGNIPLIEISAKKLETDWQFTIADNGLGIDMKYHQKIFKLFQRLHADEDIPGLGVGLTLVQRIIQRHGGTVWVESQTLSGGSIFHFTLPCFLPNAEQVSQ